MFPRKALLSHCFHQSRLGAGAKTYLKHHAPNGWVVEVMPSFVLEALDGTSVTRTGWYDRQPLFSHLVTRLLNKALTGPWTGLESNFLRSLQAGNFSKRLQRFLRALAQTHSSYTSVIKQFEFEGKLTWFFI